ncbi:MAG: hypothetical protein VX639_01440, partial [Pseudomonadota bacterium]|nr:hypothetical protein [Pseudomonadota bacterium]
NGFATLRQNKALTDGLILALCVSATVVTLGLWQASITLPEAVGNAGGISTAIIFTFLAAWYAFRRWPDAAGDRQQREVLEGRLAESALRVAAERALRLRRRPTWRFTVDGPEACTRNIEAVTGAIPGLGDVILKGPAGKDDKSAADIGLLLDYLTENLSHSMQQTCDSCLGNQPSMEINLPVKIQHHRRRRFLLRLVTSRIADLFDTQDPDHRLSRSVVTGLDIFLHQSLGDSLYAQLDQEAKEILDKIPSVQDRNIWTHLSGDRRFRNFWLRLLVLLLMALREFERGRSHLVTLITKHQGTLSSDGRPNRSFSDADFARLFGAVFSDLFELTEPEDSQT